MIPVVSRLGTPRMGLDLWRVILASLILKPIASNLYYHQHISNVFSITESDIYFLRYCNFCTERGIIFMIFCRTFWSLLPLYIRVLVPSPSFLILQLLKYLRLMQTWITSTFNPIILSGGVGLLQTRVGPSRHAARNVSP